MFRIILCVLSVLLIGNGLLAQQDLSSEKVKIAILPFYASDAKEINDTFYEVFNKEHITVVDSVEFSQNIFGNLPFNEWIFELEANCAEKNYFEKLPFIYEGLSRDRIKLWKMLLMDADYLLISSPIGFEENKSKKGKISVDLYGQYVIFNVNTGQFVIRCEEFVQFEGNVKSDNISPLIEQYYSCFKNQLDQANR